MKFSGFTDVEDYNIRTLLWMMARRECWWCGISKDWSFTAGYFWYDGPHWQIRVGPFWVHIGY